jgi:hypothetical protein
LALAEEIGCLAQYRQDKDEGSKRGQQSVTPPPPATLPDRPTDRLTG